jgi:hypothetical protein
MSSIVGTQGKDLLLADTDFLGVINGRGGDDVIVVQSVTGYTPLLEYAEHPGATPDVPYLQSFSGIWGGPFDFSSTVPVYVVGGGGDDTIILSGNGILVGTSLGDGADVIIERGVGGVVIFAGNGDTVVGQSMAEHVAAGLHDNIVYLSGSAVFLGGSDADLVQWHGALGTVGADLSGGGGNDTLLGGADVFGGKGQDVLYAANAGAVLEGGAGGDMITLLGHQFGIGGLGADHFDIRSTGAVVKGFQNAVDNATVHLNLLTSFQDPTLADLVGHVTVHVTPGGDTVILHDGDVVCRFAGDSTLHIGLRNVITESVTTLDGTAASLDQFNVIVTNDLYVGT